MCPSQRSIGLCIAATLAVGTCYPQSASNNKERAITPYDPRGTQQTWGLKGKALPIPVGDHLGLTAVLGVDYGFCTHHSIGVDGFILHISGSYDAFTDTAGVEHPDGGREWSTNKAVFLNYRCYLGFQSWRERGWAPYVGAFFRHGTVNGGGDPEYQKTDVEYHETHVSGGPLVGVLYRFPRTENWGLDVNVGAYRKHIEEVRYDQVGDVLVPFNGSRDLTGVRVGFNLYVWFFRS